MAKFVLIGGAWLGGWAWQDVAGILRASGHDVYPLSLTGLAERVHLGGPETNLTTHITDVVNLLEYEDLTEVVLVVHSYSGIVAPGVADRVPERLARIVYVDTAPLPNGTSMLDLFSPEGKEEVLHDIDERGDGWRFPLPPFEELEKMAGLRGISPEGLARFRAKAVGHPFGTYKEPLTLTRETPLDVPQHLIACDGFRELLASNNPGVEFLRGPEWTIDEMDTGHWPMLSQPADLAVILDRLAGE